MVKTPYRTRITTLARRSALYRRAHHTLPRLHCPIGCCSYGLFRLESTTHSTWKDRPFPLPLLRSKAFFRPFYNRKTCGSLVPTGQPLRRLFPTGGTFASARCTPRDDSCGRTILENRIISNYCDEIHWNSIFFFYSFKYFLYFIKRRNYMARSWHITENIVASCIFPSFYPTRTHVTRYNNCTI